MRLIALILCISVTACAPLEPIAKWPLVTIKNGGVNMGTYRPVTEVEVINGDIWLF